MLKRLLLFLFLFFCLLALVIKLKQKKSSQRKTQKDPWRLASNYPVRGLDLSHHNGKILYEGLDTLDFVFLKATEGKSHIDRDFNQHYKGFQDKGIALGVYHFFSFDTDGKEQAQHFLHRIKGYQFQIPLVVDVEHENNPKTHRDKVIHRLKDFLHYIQKKTGQKAIIYTNGIGYTDFIEKEFNDHTLWLSSTNTWRPEMMNCTFWQFNIDADLMEVTHRTDLNVFRGSREEWRNYLKIHQPYTIQ
jgi:lysozyme